MSGNIWAPSILKCCLGTYWFNAFRVQNQPVLSVLLQNSEDCWHIRPRCWTGNTWSHDFSPGKEKVKFPVQNWVHFLVHHWKLAGSLYRSNQECMGFENPVLFDKSTCPVIACSTPRGSASVDPQLCCGVNLLPLGSGAGSLEGWGVLWGSYSGYSSGERHGLGGGGWIAVSGWRSRGGLMGIL